MIEVERIISVDQERRIVTGVIQEPQSESPEELEPQSPTDC